MNTVLDDQEKVASRRRSRRFMCVLGVSLFAVACSSSTSTTTVPRGQVEQPRGLLQKVVEQVTERQCNVGRFICPYGLGPAGEPCECTDPAGYLLRGRTIK